MIDISTWSPDRRPKLWIRGQWGLGDNIFARPFVRAMTRRYNLWLETPWPELYEDLTPKPKFTRPNGLALRTQCKNIALQPSQRWDRGAPHAQTIKTFYGAAELQRGNILTALQEKMPLQDTPFIFDLPVFDPPPVNTDKPIAFIRPVTVRTEWQNEARNPLPEYVSMVTQELMQTHHVILIADLLDGKEWCLDPVPPHHEAFLYGELHVTELLGLLQISDVAIGPIGWIVPAAIAAKTKAFFILGGNGAHNAPEKITDPRMDLSRVHFAQPRNFCRCSVKNCKKCNKRIPDLMAQFATWRERVGVHSDKNVAIAV